MANGSIFAHVWRALEVGSGRTFAPGHLSTNHHEIQRHDDTTADGVFSAETRPLAGSRRHPHGPNVLTSPAPFRSAFKDTNLYLNFWLKDSQDGHGFGEGG